MDINSAYHIINNKLERWIRELIRLLPNILIAAVVLTVGILISRLIRKLATRLLRRATHNVAINNLIISIIYIFCLGITVFSALSILQLDKAVTSILAGAGIIGLALAFAFQDIAANFISGIFISFRQPIKVGHIVKIKDYMGKIQDINMRDTVIQTFQGQMVILPNKEVFQSPIENFSLLGKRRLDLTIGVSYGEDLEQVRAVTLQAVQGLSGIAADEQITLFFNEFADSSINFTLRIWIASPEQPAYLSVGSNAIIQIKKAYDDQGIVIPFPIRTLDFGIKGGVTLQEMPVTVAGAEPK